MRNPQLRLLLTLTMLTATAACVGPNQERPPSGNAETTPTATQPSGETERTSERLPGRARSLAALAPEGTGEQLLNGRRGTAFPDGEPGPPGQWAAIYRADGSIQATRGPVRSNLPVPERFLLSWAPDMSSLALVTDPALGPDAPTVGVDFAISVLESLRTTGFWVVVPTDEGTVTFGFRFRRPISWLQLEVGAQARRVSLDGRYRISAQRTKSRSWTFEVRPRRGGPRPFPYFDHGSFAIDLSGDSAPWKRVDLELDVVAQGWAAKGRIKLDLTEGA